MLVEVNCETDFVANTDDFKRLVKDIALHIASPSAPRFLTRDEVPQSELDQERQIAEVQAKEAGKPEHIVGTIVEGKINAYLKDIVLLEQPYVKDDSKTVQQLLDETSAKVGERIAVRRFARFKLGRSRRRCEHRTRRGVRSHERSGVTEKEARGKKCPEQDGHATGSLRARAVEALR